MEETERAVLARSWWQALVATGDMPMPARDVRLLLAGLVDELARSLDADPFDASAGARVGAALVTVGLTSPAVVAASAQVFYGLVDHDRPDTVRRLVALLAAFGHGYGAEVQSLRCPGRQAVEHAVVQAKRAADERFRVVFDNAAVAIAIGDTDGTLLDGNRGLAEMIGVPVEALRGVSVYDFAHPDDREEIRTLIYEKLVPAGEGTVKLEQRLMHADGSYGWTSFAITFVKGIGEQADYLLAVGEDVTEQHRMREELHRQARHDPLTGLPNRRHLLERIAAMIAAADADDRIGLCFVDLDRFKHVNDRYGHGTGDQVLTAVGTRLADSVDADGCLVARIGGDEFVALIPPPANDLRVSAVANSLITALADPIAISDLHLRMSASIGAVVMSVAGAQAESLLDAADTGLYHAKANGKGRWVMHTLESPTDIKRATTTNPGGVDDR